MKNILKYKYLLIAVIALACIITLRFIDKSEQTNSVDIVIDTATDSIVPLKYGFVIEDYDVIQAKVKRNQSLSSILSQFDVSYSTIDKIAKKAKDVFNVRKIKTGKTYNVLFSKDSLKKAQVFIYENSPVEYIVFDLSDSLSVYKGEKEVTTKRKNVSGVIESSLWNALVVNNADPFLAVRLSEVYAWTIDFFGIGKGDQFHIIYDEQYVDDISIGNQKLIAVNFIHHKTDNFAIAFEQNDKQGFFDENGKSLQKAFLKAPLRFSRISSRFSNRRFHPVLKRYRSHHGVDYAAPTGTPVHSVGDGVVIKKAYQKGGGGRYLKIKHNSVYTTVYMHFSRYAKGVSIGTRVKQGQTIGYVGQSGIATGPHLDYRVYKNGKAINPLKLKSPPVSPIDSAYLNKYNLLKDSLIIELSKLNVPVILKDSLIVSK